MKLSLIMIFAGILQVSASVYSQQTRMTFSMKDKLVKEVLNKIEQSTDFRFFYNENFTDLNKQVTIDARNNLIEEIMDELLSTSEVTYRVLDNNLIVITPKSVLQQGKVTGKVTDATTGEPMAGVYVRIEGTNTGVVTDVNGNYSVDLPSENASLQFSFVGYNVETIPVSGKSAIDVALTPEIQELEQVVVVGYGVQKKSNVTGSIASVQSDDLENRATENVGKALQGKVSGVQVLTLSGAPGSAATFRVRGYSNNSSSDPLYIVDGLKVNDISYLDPGNIASIEILKDAASAAIYGAEAGNGVVLISTKTGKAGTSRIFYNMQYSIQSQSSKLDMMDADQFKAYWMQSGTLSTSFQTAKTDWQDVVFEDGRMVSHNLGMTGGNEKGSYYVSLTYSDNNGMVVGKKDTYKRLTAQVNADYNFKPWLKIGTTNVIERGKTETVSSNGMTTSGSVIGGAYFYDPTVPAFYEKDADAATILLPGISGNYPNMRNGDGKLYGSSYILSSDLGNPLSMISKADNKSWRTNVNGTLYAEIKPVKNLIYTSRVGYRIGNTSTSTYGGGYYWGPMQNQILGSLSASMNQSVYVQWENFANYNYTFGKHNITAMAGMKFATENTQSVGGSTNQLNSDSPNYRYLSYSYSNATSDNVSGDNIKASNLSYFGRLEWNYGDKYMLQGSYRADAFDASKLSKENRWGYFPSVSAGWVMSNENFMKNLNLNAISFLKLRASWGINGNIGVLSGYPYTTSINVGSTYYNMGNILISGASPSIQLPNSELTWEKSKQTDLGFESRFFNNRLSFAMDYYKKITDGLLGSITPPVVSGTSTMLKNLGKVENHGFEFELGWKDKVGDFSYSINGNLATLYNEMLVSPYGATGRKSVGGGFQTEATYMEEGYPLNYIRTYIVDHIDEATGQPVYKTAAELGTDDGKAQVGSAIPDFMYGATVTAAYKGFDLRVSGVGQQGSELFFAIVRPDVPRMNLPAYLFEEGWTPDNTNAEYASSSVFSSYPSAQLYGSSDAFVFNSSYFKIKEIQLGYTLPVNFSNKLKIGSLRVYMTLDNFFTITKYPGSDPETMADTKPGTVVSFGGMNISIGGGMGTDRVQYPSMKQILFGVNLSF